MNFLQSVKGLFSKTSSKITSGLVSIFSHKKLSKEILEDLELLLLASDLGPRVTQQIIDIIAKERFDREITQADVEKVIIERVEDSLTACEKEFILSQELIEGAKKPLTVVVMCGVNGNGKTTSIGKLADHMLKQGLKISIAACDTFRAAAVEQLQIWGERAGCPVIVADNDKADPASVAYRATKHALENEIDVLFVDTAGRLHNQTNLMSELSKIISTIEKITKKAPDYTMLVLDATIGQHAHSQVEEFQKYAGINGLIITKLDGTAKAGVVVGLAEKFKLPIYFLGTGESSSDIVTFKAKSFAQNLLQG